MQMHLEPTVTWDGFFVKFGFIERLEDAVSRCEVDF